MEASIDKYFWLIFPVFWICFCYLIALVSGWKRLADNYATKYKPPGIVWRFESAQLRFAASYSGCLNFSTTKQGLYVSILFLFRPGHESLYIPWSDVQVYTEKKWFRRVVRIQVGSVPILIKEKLAYELRGVAGDGWPKHT